MAAKEGSIQISDLSIPQLEQLKLQLDEELQVFNSSGNQLKLVQQKFTDSLEGIKKIAKDNNQGKEILVPLTDSLYVPGVLNSVDSLLVDIGTGYFVDKNAKEGIEYFERKVTYVLEQIEKLQKIVVEKYNSRQAIIESLQMKVQQHLAAQKSGAQA